MNHENMKRISLAEVQALPEGTRVCVELIGEYWSLERKEYWNIKKEDGLYYEDKDEISFQFDFDYVGNGMEIFCYVGEYGCDCCLGDEAVYWQDNENNAFVDSKGEMSIMVKDKLMRFKVKFCPCCGKKF